MLWAAAGFFALLVMVDRPVSVVVAVPESLRHAESVSLRMEGVVMRRDAPATWNVFWDRQDDAHFVGYVSSPANSSLRDPKPANFILQLPVAAVAALHRQKEMRFTFVPVRKLPEGGVTMTTLRLE
jgi:hypothetical protein